MNPRATLTVDTSVVIAASDDASSPSAELLRRARSGEFDVAVSTRVAFQLTRPLQDADLARYVEGLPKLGSPARWGDPADRRRSPSTYGGGDTYAAIPDARPNVSFGSKLDDDHLEAHRASGRDHFVTLDDGQRKRALKLGLSVLMPEELLARYPSELGEPPGR